MLLPAADRAELKARGAAGAVVGGGAAGNAEAEDELEGEVAQQQAAAAGDAVALALGLGNAVKSVEAGGKLACLKALLQCIVAEGRERVVVVSSSTAALDLVAGLLCAPMGLRVVRIDGGTGVDERQGIVDAFNVHGVGQVRLGGWHEVLRLGWISGDSSPNLLPPSFG